MSEMVDRVAEAISAQIDGPEHTHPVFEPEHYKAMARAAAEAYKKWEQDELANEYGPSWHERLRLAQIVMRRGWI